MIPDSPEFLQGYADGRDARPALPPTDSTGRAEYLDGYRDGDHARVYCPAAYDLELDGPLTDGWCDDVNPGHLIPN